MATPVTGRNVDKNLDDSHDDDWTLDDGELAQAPADDDDGAELDWADEDVPPTAASTADPVRQPAPASQVPVAASPPPPASTVMQSTAVAAPEAPRADGVAAGGTPSPETLVGADQDAQPGAASSLVRPPIKVVPGAIEGEADGVRHAAAEAIAGLAPVAVATGGRSRSSGGVGWGGWASGWGSSALKAVTGASWQTGRTAGYKVLGPASFAMAVAPCATWGESSL
jgi:hypothetical protein